MIYNIFNTIEELKNHPSMEEYRWNIVSYVMMIHLHMK
jgi:hypothetical protein